MAAAAEALRKSGGAVNDAVTSALTAMDENALVRGSRQAVSTGPARLGRVVY